MISWRLIWSKRCVAVLVQMNRLANHARIINLGQIDMRRHRNEQARADDTYCE